MESSLRKPTIVSARRNAAPIRRAIIVAGCCSVLASAACDLGPPKPPTEPVAVTKSAVSSKAKPYAHRTSLPRGTSGGVAPASPNVASYGGGIIMSKVNVTPVFWNSSVNVSVQAFMPPFLTALTDSGYLDMLGEYYAWIASKAPIGRGTTNPAVVLVPNNNNKVLSETDVENELNTQIANGVLWFPEDQNTMYMVFFPPGITVTGSSCGTSCVDYCGCHLWNSTSILGSYAGYSWGIIPDFGNTSGCRTGCGTSGMLPNMEWVTSHELAEAVTDPDPGNGWTPEIGDSCLGQTASLVDSQGTSWTVQKVWSNEKNACIASNPQCQRISDEFGTTAGVTWGFAPPDVQGWWTQNNCMTSPHFTSTNLCQKISEIYGVSPSYFSYAPASVQSFWNSNGCATTTLAPVDSDDLCRRAADAYGIILGETYGSAPDYVRQWFDDNGCISMPHGLTPCQKAADFYGEVAGVGTGFAPQDVATEMLASGCTLMNSNTNPTDLLCQNLSNMYATDAGISWGGAPANAQNFWIANGCNSHPTCQGISELYGTAHGQTWAAAPSWIQNWWSAHSCTTVPLWSQNPCQTIADNFGFNSNADSGLLAPDFVQSWFLNFGCGTHARSDMLREYNIGPLANGTRP
jgi:hypothetical protein